MKKYFIIIVRNSVGWNMPNAIASLAFCYSSEEKAKNGHIGRFPVILGQARNAVVSIKDSIMDLDNSLSKSAQSATEAYERLAESNKFIDYAGKTVGFISKHVNKFIIGSSALDVALAKDKKTTAVENTLGLGAMYGAENLYKKYAREEDFAEGIGKCLKNCSKGEIKAIAHIAHGVPFVAASLFSYYIGGKFGDLLLGKATMDDFVPHRHSK